MALTPAVCTARARVAGLTKHQASPAKIDAARRDLRAARAKEYIRSVVETVPPLTTEQIEELRALLPTDGGAR